MKNSHLIVRADHVLCTRCMKTEPIHQGNGTPMGTLIIAYNAMALRHQDCDKDDERHRK